MVYELRRWRKAKVDWRSACSGNGQRCKAYELCRGIILKI